MENELERLTRKYCSGELTAEQAARLNELIGRSRCNMALFRKRVEEYSAESSSFRAEEAWREFAAKNDTLFTAPRKIRTRHIGGGIAAAFAAAAMLAIGLFYTSPADTAAVENSAEESAARVVEYRTGRGEKMNIVLADGSTVCLNSETTLTVARDFGNARREIFFDGEGFFDIARDEKRPFVIHCANDDYTVLGTSFNLQSYAKENFAVVTLHTGCLQAKVRKDAIILDPNEQLQIDAERNTIVKREVNVDDSIGWINGRLVFSGMPLRDVANKLSRRFQVKINVHEDICRQEYTGVVDEETLDEALNMIVAASPVRMTVTNIDGEYFLSRCAKI